MGIRPPIMYATKVEAFKAYARKTEAYEHLVKMDNILWTHTSLESQELVQRLPEYEEESRGKNPYWLYHKLKSTHFLQPTGMTLKDREELKKAWSVFKMRDNKVSAQGLAKRDIRIL